VGVPAGELLRVEQLFDRESLVAFHLAVVRWCVRLGFLVPGQVAKDPNDSRHVVGDDAVDMVNAVGMPTRLSMAECR
jgi:hypothetical protein